MHHIHRASHRYRRHINDLDVSTVGKLPDYDPFALTAHLRIRRRGSPDDVLRFPARYSVLGNVPDILLAPDELDHTDYFTTKLARKSNR